jgi:hypothetical protein
MSEQITLGFTVASTDYSAPLGLRVSLDQNIIYESNHVNAPVEIQHQLLDDEGEHELTFEMFGKQPEHTTIDDAGNIVSDAVLNISTVELDGIDINYLFQQLTVYHHDFNGTQAAIEEKCYGTMGCNGTVRLKFTSPIYLWFLENM